MSTLGPGGTPYKGTTINGSPASGGAGTMTPFALQAGQTAVRPPPGQIAPFSSGGTFQAGGTGGQPSIPMGGFSGSMSGSTGSTPAAPPASSSSNAQFSTGITPSGVYTPGQTQQMVNQQMAAGQQMADPRYQQKQFTSPGRSNDAGTMGAAAPGIAQAQFGGLQGAAQTPLQDLFANQQQMLSGQSAQQGEAAGMQNALLGQYNQNIYQNNAAAYPMLGLLGQLM